MGLAERQGRMQHLAGVSWWSEVVKDCLHGAYNIRTSMEPRVQFSAMRESVPRVITVVSLHCHLVGFHKQLFRDVRIR